MTLLRTDDSASLKHQWLVRFEHVTHLISLSPQEDEQHPRDHEAATEQDQLLGLLSERTGWPASHLQLQSLQYPFATARVQNRILGGKGGFGTLLKGQSKQAGAKRTTDFGACRDLQGRRLRHVNDEIKLRKWREVQQQKAQTGTSDESVFYKTASGLYNWHLMVPNWASDSLSQKATRKMQRQMEREAREWQSEEQKKRQLRQEKEELYRHSVVRYAQEGLQHQEEGNVKSAVLQGLQHKRQERSSQKRKLTSGSVASEESEESSVQQQQALVTLSGEWVVEETESENGRGWQIQSKSDFGTMALVLDRDLPPSRKDSCIYLEVKVVTGGMAQVGWADLSQFAPETDTGDGVGDDGASFAYDGSRRLKFHNGTETQYGDREWKEGDVIGLEYRPSTGELSYWLNGNHLGVAFSTTPQRVLVPAMSCNEHEILELDIHKDTMQFIPKHCIPVFELLNVASTGEQGEALPQSPGGTNESQQRVDQPSKTKPKRPKMEKEKLEAAAAEEPLNLDNYQSADELVELGMDRLKEALIALGVKCGGSLEERATRLFSLKGLERKDYPKKLRSKHFVV